MKRVVASVTRKNRKTQCKGQGKVIQVLCHGRNLYQRIPQDRQWALDKEGSGV